MSLKSYAKDHLISRLRSLQENLNTIILLENSTPEKEQTPINISKHAGDLFFVLNASGEIQNINETVSESLHYTKEELIGLHFVDIIPPLQKKACRELFNSLDSNAPSLTFHVSFISAQNKNFDCDCKVLKKGSFIYVLAALQSSEN